MAKSLKFESKTSEEMYRSLEEDEEGAPRRVKMMDPEGPFRRTQSEATKGRFRAMSSNISMEDVSGSTHLVNTNQLPKAPTFKGSTTAEKRQFIKEYNAYYDKLTRFCTPSNTPMVYSVASCIDPWVRDFMARFELGKDSAEDVTEEEWVRYFKGCEEAELKDVAVLDAAMAKIKLNLALGDATSMMSSLTQKIYKTAEELGLLVFVEKNDPKRMTNYLIEALEPPVFKQRVKGQLAMEANKDKRKDPIKAHRWIRDYLAAFLEHSTEDWSKSKKDQSSGTKKESSTGAKRQGKQTPVGDKVKDEAQDRPGRHERQKFACLKCQSREHDVRRCPQIRDGEAEALIQEYREKKAKKEVRFVQREDNSQESDRRLRTLDKRGRVPVKLRDSVETEALLDSGADCCLISRGLVEKLEKETGFLQMKLLDKPEAVGTAGSDIEVRRLVCLESVVFQTTAGPLRWRNLKCWVDERDSGQLLLVDRPTMQEMGYSADALLVAAKRKLETPGLSEDGIAAERRISMKQKPFVRFLCHKDEALYQSDVDGDMDGFEENMLTPEIQGVEQQRDQIKQILVQKVQEAAENGLAEKGRERLVKALEEYIDVFRVSFAKDPPINVEPMEIKLRPDAQPVMARSRRYPPLHRKYLQEHMEELEKYGLVYKNPDARWGSAPRIVPKRNGSLRMTVDLRAVNAMTIPRAWPMPHQEAEMADIEGSTCFAGFDGFSQYWQESTAENSRELLSIVTPSGIYTPTRVLMGATDAVAYTQQTMERVMAPLLNRGVKVWLDDILGYARSQEELLDRVEIVLQRCMTFGLKLHPGKCDFYMTTVKWCGKMISASGVSHCPIRIQGLVEMPTPQTAADLQQFLCACNWMRASIPRYSELVSELSLLLENCMAKGGSRKKNKLVRLLLKDCGWSEAHEQVFARLKGALMDMVPLAHPREDADVCVYTDASQDHWGAVITQVVPNELSKPREAQEHEPLAFLSGAFKGASSRWPIVEKEAFAIVETCKRMEYLLLRERGFHLFTDHRNLQYIFDPKTVNSNIARYQADKLQRWSMVLQMFRYEIEYISGEENVWGDLLSRWGSPNAEAQKKTVYRLVSVAPLKDEDFKWPSFQEIAEVQKQHLVKTDGFIQDPETKCWKTKSGKVWLPEEAVDLKQRLCVVAHAGLAGHRGINTTVTALQADFAWKYMQQDVTAFINGCLHCLVVNGERVPRPFGQTLTATRPNESIHFDFMKLPKSVDGQEYVLVLKDAMSGFVELIPCPSCTAEACVDALCEWFKRYGPVFQWVSDQGSHFKNQAVDGVAKLFGAHHHFVTAYCPWANGTVEVVNRMLLRVLKSMLSESQLPMAEWSKLLFQVQMALNFNPSSRLDGVAPVTAFMALPACTPLKTFYLSKYDGRLPVVKEVEWSEEIQGYLQDLQASLEVMHKRLASAAAQKLVTKRDRRAAAARSPNFELGDFVLVGRTLARANKLALEWKGPCRVVGIKSHWLYDVQTLFEPVVTTTHHVSRLKFYVDKDRGKIEDLKLYAVAHQDTFLVDQLLECRCVQGSWEVKVKWQGFDLMEATWEPLGALQVDVPVMVKQVLETPPHESFRRLKSHLAAVR